MNPYFSNYLTSTQLQHVGTAKWGGCTRYYMLGWYLLEIHLDFGLLQVPFEDLEIVLQLKMKCHEIVFFKDVHSLEHVIVNHSINLSSLPFLFKN